MKKLILIPILTLLTAIPAKAQKQQEAQTIIDKQYAGQLHRDLIYRISPQSKEADSAFIAAYTSSAKDYAAKSSFAAPGDTSWRYSEYKLKEDSIWTPASMYYLYSEHIQGDEYNHFYKELSFTGQTDYHTTQLQRTHSIGDFTDSTISLYYDPNGTITYGSRFINSIQPSEGADREHKWENYNAAAEAWEMQRRTLYYKGELYDTLTIEYNLDFDTKEEFIGGEFRYRVTDKYILNDYRYYAYVTDGKNRFTSWYYSYTRLGEDGRYIYSVQKNLNAEGTGLANRDSLAYDYSTAGKVSGLLYSWADSVYILTGAYDTFYSEINGSSVADSLVYYHIVQNQDTGEYEKGGIRIKTEFGYNGEGQQVLVRNYIDPEDGNGLRLQSETRSEYNSLGIMIRRTGYVASGGMLIKNYETYHHYDGERNWWYSQTVNFDAEGAVYYGTRDELATIDKDNFDGFKYFSWDTAADEWRLIRYRIARLPAGEGITQSLDYTVTERGYMQRSINNNYSGNPVAVMNDGPLHVESGDTLMFYISAREIDGSIPKVEISGLPEGAEFDPESRRFFWTVGNVADGEMTVKATGKQGASETVVYWYTGSITTDTEEENTLPRELVLEQNYPNPFNPATNIRFEIPEVADVRLEVYNLLGQKVAAILNKRMPAGSYTVPFNASALSSGVYIYRLMAADKIAAGRMVLMK